MDFDFRSPFFYIPNVEVVGSLKIFNSGVLNVNKTKSRAITQSDARAILGRLQAV